MMKIEFTPQRNDQALALSVAGDTLNVNGQPFDFAPLPEGGVLPYEALDNPWFAGPVTRTNGQLVLSMIYPYGPDVAACAFDRFTMDIQADGPVELP